MAEAAVRSKAVILLLLICCLVCFSMVAGVLCLSLFCCALLVVVSSFAIILKMKRKLDALFLLSCGCSCYCKYSVTLPHGAVGWSAVFGCDIFFYHTRKPYTCKLSISKPTLLNTYCIIYEMRCANAIKTKPQQWRQ